MALYEQTRLDARQIALKQTSIILNTTTPSAEATEVDSEAQQAGQFFDSEFKCLLDKLTYIFVIFKLRASMRPYGFSGSYSFTSVDLRYAIELLVKEFAAQLAKDNKSFCPFANQFFEKLLHEICFGNRISALHDKVIAKGLLTR